MTKKTWNIYVPFHQSLPPFSGFILLQMIILEPVTTTNVSLLTNPKNTVSDNINFFRMGMALADHLKSSTSILANTHSHILLVENI